MPDAIDLDHVALATEDPDAALGALVGALGATVVEGGDGHGFRWVQARLGDGHDGMTVEVITPTDPDEDDFLHRFVERHGEGQHHITFKVPDLRAVLDRATAAGYHPVGISFDDPEWCEAFLVPREAQGTVVQLAASQPPPPPWPERFATRVAEGTSRGRPRWWVDPAPTDAPRAVLRRIVLRTTSITSALGLWCGLLGGLPVDQGDDRIELVWPGGRILLLEDPQARPGFERLEVEVTGGGEPVQVAGVALHRAGA